MQAMLLERLGEQLKLVERPDPMPGDGEVRVRVGACGVCRTDLHVVDGELPDPQLPIIPGHEIVGRIDAIGPGVEGSTIGQRVGIPWLGHTCGIAPTADGAREPLRPSAVHRLYPRRRLRHARRSPMRALRFRWARRATMWRWRRCCVRG